MIWISKIWSPQYLRRSFIPFLNTTRLLSAPQGSQKLHDFEDTSQNWMFLQVFGYQKWSVLVAPCTKRSAMLILGTIRSFRASGFNLFSRRKMLRSGLPKRFGLWMSRDCACFLFRLRNAGAYIPFWDTLYAPRFYKFTYERMSRSS